MLPTRVKDAFYTLVRSVGGIANSVVILSYHTISDSKTFGAVTPEMFEAQMRYLYEAHFNVISLAQLAELFEKGSLPPKTVCITFDDGYRDNYSIAYPILKKYNLPATLFVVSDWIGKKSAAYHGEEIDLLSEVEICELDTTDLIAIESHTAAHQVLPSLSLEACEEEIRRSREKLERLLGRPVQHLAYPKGRHSKEVRDAAARARVRFAYTTLEGVVRTGDDFLQLHRNGIDRTVTLAQFKGMALLGRLSRLRLFA